MRVLVFAAFRAAVFLPDVPFVRAAFLAAVDRLDALRFDAAFVPWADKARVETAECPSRFSAFVVARDRADDFAALVFLAPARFVVARFVVARLALARFVVARLVLDFLAAERFAVAFLAVIFFADDLRAVVPPARLRAVDFFSAVPDERFFDAALLSCAAFFLVDLLALFDGLAFTPARRALDNPIAMACFAERAPCLPSRTCSISSCTNSPAWVEADFP